MYKISELPVDLKSAEKKLASSYGGNTNLVVVQTDIKQMFTNLDHEHIKRAVDWLVDQNIKIMTRKTRNKPFINISTTKTSDGKYDMYWSRAKGNCGWRSIDIPSLLDVVNIDLDNAFQTIGGKMYKQNFGCPIGGKLSAIYANVLCAFDENSFFKSLGRVGRRIAGIRQVDDLLFMVSYEMEDRVSREEAERVRDLILRKGGVYKGGLELVPQEPVYQQDKKIIFKFAGTEVCIFKEGKIKFQCRPLLKNLQGLQNNGRLDFPRFVEITSICPTTHKISCLVGTLYRLLKQVTDEKFLLFALWVTLLEFYSLGSTMEFLLKIVFRVSLSQNVWRNLGGK